MKFIDFKNRDNNRFIAVCQFKVRILGTERHIIPDIVLFLNGVPVVVIECKSPKVKDPIPEAITQLMRYSEQRGAKGGGSAPMFFYNQFVITTCRQEAKFGTITTHNEKHFYRWSDPYPRSLNDLDHGSSSPNAQQRLVAGMLDRDNLLNLIFTFTIFSTNDKGEMIKVVARYQQFPRSTDKAAGGVEGMVFHSRRENYSASRETPRQASWVWSSARQKLWTIATAGAPAR